MKFGTIVNESTGSKQVQDLLALFNIRYRKELGLFKNPLTNRNLYYDYGIFDDNGELVGLIEYDGRQHFEPLTDWGGVRKFKEQQFRDALKDQYCKHHSIPLLRVNYLDDTSLYVIISTYLAKLAVLDR